MYGVQYIERTLFSITVGPTSIYGVCTLETVVVVSEVFDILAKIGHTCIHGSERVRSNDGKEVKDYKFNFEINKLGRHHYSILHRASLVRRNGLKRYSGFLYYRATLYRP